MVFKDELIVLIYNILKKYLNVRIINSIWMQILILIKFRRCHYYCWPRSCEHSGFLFLFPFFFIHLNLQWWRLHVIRYLVLMEGHVQLVGFLSIAHANPDGKDTSVNVRTLLTFVTKNIVKWFIISFPLIRVENTFISKITNRIWLRKILLILQ